MKFLGIVLSLLSIAAITPATQPGTGPGGAEYRHAKVVAKSFGEEATAYWLFEPAEPKPASAPLIVFNHGWGAMQPAPYGAWIDHLVRRGNIVVYPVYQSSLRTAVADFTPNAIAAATDAIARLGDGEHVKPELEKFAIVGHSMGGIVSANMAALCAKNNLPTPRAVLCVQPGKTWAVSSRIAVKLEDLSAIPKEMLLIALVGDRDTIAREVDAKRIFKESKSIPPENKNYILLVSDDHGEPALKATHFAPCAPNSKYVDERSRALRTARQDDEGMNIASVEPFGLDALDFYGTWKLFDALTDAAFYGKNREFALGNTPQQRFMGRWSDGTAITELQIIEKP